MSDQARGTAAHEALAKAHETLAAEWPTREQMERVQELAATSTVRVERYGADGMKVTVGLDVVKRFDVDGNAVEEAPTQVSGVQIPLSLARALLGDEAVDEAIREASGASSPDYRVGWKLGARLIAAIEALVAPEGSA